MRFEKVLSKKKTACLSCPVWYSTAEGSEQSKNGRGSPHSAEKTKKNKKKQIETFCGVYGDKNREALQKESTPLIEDSAAHKEKENEQNEIPSAVSSTIVFFSRRHILRGEISVLSLCHRGCLKKEWEKTSRSDRKSEKKGREFCVC